MAGGQCPHHDLLYYSSSPSEAPEIFRIVGEFDFFAAESSGAGDDDPQENLTHVYFGPVPENPQALCEFFVPELTSPPCRVPMKRKIDDMHALNRGKMEVEPLPPRPVFHEKILEGIGVGPVFLFQKMLGDLDSKDEFDTLSILKREKVMGFLFERERGRVSCESEVRVILTEAEEALKEYKLVLQNRYDEVLVLRDGWGQVVADYKLKAGDLVQGWGYRRRRHSPRLRLALSIT